MSMSLMPQLRYYRIFGDTSEIDEDSVAMLPQTDSANAFAPLTVLCYRRMPRIIAV